MDVGQTEYTLATRIAGERLWSEHWATRLRDAEAGGIDELILCEAAARIAIERGLQQVVRRSQPNGRVEVGYAEVISVFVCGYAVGGGAVGLRCLRFLLAGVDLDGLNLTVSETEVLAGKRGERRATLDGRDPGYLPTVQGLRK